MSTVIEAVTIIKSKEADDWLIFLSSAWIYILLFIVLTHI